MAVSITKKLTSSPLGGTLPLAITLHQSLSTNIPPEQATIVYELREPSGDVGFDTAGNKTMTTTRTVAANSPPFVDSVILVGTLTGAMLSIRQTLTDQSGSRMISHCTINLKGAP
ncbi:MAG TPA: hypothetical protein VKY89_08880 [Thermoanaerobaculia bacterium]|nr:hypothetical protein [Thermoanaerobaculia bacterium]